jgi:hypothetical protein
LQRSGFNDEIVRLVRRNLSQHSCGLIQPSFGLGESSLVRKRAHTLRSNLQGAVEHCVSLGETAQRREKFTAHRGQKKDIARIQVNRLPEMSLRLAPASESPFDKCHLRENIRVIRQALARFFKGSQRAGEIAQNAIPVDALREPRFG